MRLLVVVAALCAGTAAAGTISLTVAFCPTVFSGAGAVLSVDAATGNFSIVGKSFSWPGISDDGCPVDIDPNVYQSSTLTYLDVTEK